MAASPYSLKRELGTMFGFLAACILTVGLYYIFWQAIQRRAAARDDARRKDLRARGFHHERGGYHDKALNRYASRDPIAQSQGQTLEFLTEPGLDNTTAMSGSMMSAARSSLSNDCGQSSSNNHDASSSDKYLEGTASRDYQLPHNGGGAGAGLRINSSVRSQSHSQSRQQSQNQDQIQSAVSNHTPSTIHHETGTGQSANDLF